MIETSLLGGLLEAAAAVRPQPASPAAEASAVGTPADAFAAWLLLAGTQPLPLIDGTTAEAWAGGDGNGLPQDGETLPPGRPFAGGVAAILAALARHRSPAPGGPADGAQPAVQPSPMPEALGALLSSPTAADDESAAPVQAFVEHLRDIAAMRQTTLRPGASEPAIAAGLLGAEPRPGPVAEAALARVDAAVAATAAGSAVLPGAESRTAPPPAPVSAFAWSPLSTELDRGFGERLVWMAQQGIKTARVRVHPEHLGPIDIRLKLDGDSAQVTLVAPHALARDALEQALPRLREVLGDAGVTLTEAQVDHRGGGAADRHPDETDADAIAIGASGAAREGAAEETPHRLALVRVGLVDRFA